MAETEIEWTDRVWNVVRGCSRVSPGCGGAAGEGGCYAERQAARFAGPGMPYEGLVRIGKQGPRWTGEVRLIREKLREPFSWKKPQRVFVNSMSDLFHEGLSFEDIAAVFGVMAQSPQHTFQVLTKRAKRMAEWFRWVADHGKENGPPPDQVVTTCAANLIDIDQIQRPWPLPNVWLGASVEDQKRADERIPWLSAVPATVRFLSYEPALDELNLGRALMICRHWKSEDSLPNAPWCPPWPKYRWEPQALVAAGWRRPIDWVIVGGESGPGARRFSLDWCRNIVAQCRVAKVACFVKQLGAYPSDALSPLDRLALKNRKGGDPSEWPPGDWPREFPEPQR